MPDTDQLPLNASEPTLPPAPAQPVIAFPHTGDYRKDALIESLDYRWNRTMPVGTAVSITYSFAAAPPTYANGEDIAGFMPLSAYERDIAREVFVRVASFAGISFTEVADSGSSYGQIRFSKNQQTDSSGYAYLPFSSGTDLDGDIFISVDSVTNQTSFEQDYGLFAHEIYHALGLKHPGNYNAGENPSTNTAGNFLGELEDSLAYTTMSYREVAQGQQSFGGVYDVLALQYLYGRRLVETGNNVYSLTDNQGTLLTTLIDDGGADTINLSVITAGAVIDLREGALNSIGLVSPGVAALNNYAIAFGSRIENVTGTNFADRLSGNDTANTLSGGAGADLLSGRGGNDSIDGGGGFDISIHTGARSAYTVSALTSGRMITDSTPNRDGADTLSNIERLQFSDGVLAFDNLRSDMAGKGYLLYRAAFDRAPDAEGLGYWIRELDRGQNYGAVVAASFIASREFTEKYGANLSHAAFVNQLYQNVLHRAGEADGVAYWLSELNGGGARSNMLASFAISDENFTAVSPIITDGIWFV